MNNTFNFNRFGKLLAFDGRKYLRHFGLTFAILCGLNLVLWLLTLIFGFSMPTLPSYCIIYLALFLSIILVPAKAFGDINLPREGVRYAMLPVSNWEKYLSYTLFCLLTPFLVVFCSWCFDSLLTLLPFGGFNHYIRHLGFVNVMQDLVMELGAAEVEGIDEFNELQSLKGLFGPAYTTSIILSIVFNVGFFMFGNLLFKTHKTGKTFAIMIGFSYVMSLFSQLFFLAKGSSLLVSHNVADLNLIKELTSGLMSFSNILYVFLTIGLFIGLFYKLKTQKY